MLLFHQIPPGSNRFMWQDAVNKRLIIMNEPVLDEVAIEGCKEVFEGTECYVPVKMKSDQFLAPTPVIITSNTYLWA
ncbi:NS1-like protein [Dinothrombium tinctorium]|uniref:NS1-like protein n=1 Tax=Dinothrombium tinctorium TaxID=1965070 RepID=A0A443QB72_9ACAR|nr:NS1-like protein [Dinothrombium tinctorium]